MGNVIAQIGVITRYEIKLNWRRRSLLVITLAMLVLPVGLGLLMGNSLAGTVVGDTELEIATAVVPTTWFGIYIVLVLMLPVIVSDTIPKDEQYNVRDLLFSMPMTTGTYLLGKFTGACISAFVSVGIVALVSGIVWRIILGAFDLPIVIEMWVLGALPLVFMNSGLTVLLAAAAKTRRAAIGVGVGFVTVCMFLLTTALGGMAFGGTPDLLFNMSPARPAYFWRFGRLFEGLGGSELQNPVTANDVWMTLLFGAAQVVIAGLVMWLWLRWRAE